MCKIANVLRQWGVKRGDTVAVYMPMIPELAFVMLACARIGAPHSVVFAGFSATSLKDRIVDASSKWVICADEGKRGGRTIALKAIVDEGTRRRRRTVAVARAVSRLREHVAHVCTELPG